MIRVVIVLIATAIAASAQSINPRVFLLEIPAAQKRAAKLEADARKALGELRHGLPPRDEKAGRMPRFAGDSIAIDGRLTPLLWTSSEPPRDREFASWQGFRWDREQLVGRLLPLEGPDLRLEL